MFYYTSVKSDVSILPQLVLESRYITQLFVWSFVITAVGYVGLNLLYQGFLM